MSNIIEDILFLILKELLQYENNSFHSCLLVNKTWCEISIPILWKNPWIVKEEKGKLLLNVIISHLSNEANEYLRSQGINLSSAIQKPSFNYISVCKHLDIINLERMISDLENLEEQQISIVMNEILKLFINTNKTYTHFYIPSRFDYQIRLMPEAERCFSELKFLCCYIDDANQSVLEGSLIKYANTVQYSCLVNLISLEIIMKSYKDSIWSNLKNVSLPVLKILKAKNVPSKVVTSLIKITKGNLIEIIIEEHEYDHNNSRHIQAIYQNCPNLKYLKLYIRKSEISELENLLINCQHLDGLFIIAGTFNNGFCDTGGSYQSWREHDGWSKLLKVLVRSSPTSLFKFKLTGDSCYYTKIESETLESFFDNWKCRHPMLLHFTLRDLDTVEKYKEKGIIRKFIKDFEEDFEDFEWIHQKKGCYTTH